MRKFFSLLFSFALISGFTLAQEYPVSNGPAPQIVKSNPDNWTQEPTSPLTTVGFAHSTSNDQFVSLPLPGGTPLTIIGAQVYADFAGGGCFGGDGLFYVSTVGNTTGTPEIWIQDITTGVATLVGPTGLAAAEGFNGIAYDWSTDTYYGASGINLYTFDNTTGTATLVGPFNNTGGLSIDIAIDCDGNMFMHDLGLDVMFTVDKTTGNATQLGSTGFLANFGQGMGYDHDDGTLYLFAFNATTFTAQLRTVDVTTGLTTLVFDYGLDQHAPFDGQAGCVGGCFSDDFDAYTAGTQLVAQNNVDWDTWSGGGGTGEDPFVTDLYSFSGNNSIVVIPGNDFVRKHGDLTAGKWYMSWAFYIPAGQSGYFNTMNDFIQPTGGTWGMDCFFDVGGTGRVDTTGGGGGGANDVPFTWSVGAWNQALVVVDLDLSVAEFWHASNPTNLTLIATWDWTQNGTKVNQLAVNDFYGGRSTDEMYIDDYYFCDTPPAVIPVELTSFTANVNRNRQVELNWSTASETNNQLFEIERRTEEGQFAAIGYVEGHGTTTEPQNYSYTDVTVSTGIYFYRLKQLDFLGSYEYFDEIEVDVSGPLTFDLEQNYPNPFNPSTNIKYSVPESGDVRLAVYNLVGEEVAVLVDGFTEAGFFEVTFDASSLSSGVYFYKLQSGNSIVAKKMLLMK